VARGPLAILGADVLRNRNFRLLLAGQAVSALGDRMVVLALAFAVLEIGGSASDVGLVLAAGAAPMVATVLLGGVVGDRLPRRRVMVTADLVRVASQGAMAALLIGGSAEVWSLAALAAVTGTASGMFNPASTAMLPELLGPSEFQQANALRWTGVSIGEILGPVLAGIIVAAASAGWAVAVDALTFAISAACLAKMRMGDRPPREAPSFMRDLKDGWTAFRSRRWVWAFVLYFAVGNLLWAAWSALGPIVAEDELGGAAVWGLVLTAQGVGALTGSLVATRAAPRRPLLFVAGAEGLFGLPLAFLAAGVPGAILAGSAFVSGIGLTLGMSVWESTLQRHIPGTELARVSSYDWFGSLAFFPLGLAIWGPVAAVMGTTSALWIAFGGFAATLAVLAVVPDVRRLPPSPAPDSG
jgi:MFS family permease